MGSGLLAKDRKIEVVRQDVAHDDPPGDGFDLVHARLVLIHIAERDEALRRMVSVLRPGGWLLIEDFGVDMQTMICPDVYGPDQHLANKVKDAFRSLLLDRGVDPTFGRRLPRLLRDLGLANVTADNLGEPTRTSIDMTNPTSTSVPRSSLK